MKLGKEGDFLGKARLAKQKAEEGPAYRHRMVSIKVPELTAEAGPYLIHNEPIWKGREIVGHVTSGDWGFRLDAMVGLATVEKAGGASKDWIEEGGFEVQIAGKMYPIEAQLGPFYDPKGDVMRS